MRIDYNEIKSHIDKMTLEAMEDCKKYNAEKSATQDKVRALMFVLACVVFLNINIWLSNFVLFVMIVLGIYIYHLENKKFEYESSKFDFDEMYYKANKIVKDSYLKKEESLQYEK